MKFSNVTVSANTSVINANVNVIGTSNTNYGVSETVSYDLTDEVVYYAPLYGPFYYGITITDYDASNNATVLVHGIDYVVKMPFMHMTELTKSGCFTGVKFLRDLTGVKFVMSYVSVGSIFTTKTPYGNIVNFERSYEENFYQPDYSSIYTAANTTLTSVQDNVSGANIASSINAISTALANYSINDRLVALNAIGHEFNFNNPHGDTASNIGLGNVANYPPATAIDYTSDNNSCYITPYDLTQIINTDNAVFASNTIAGLIVLNTSEADVTNVLTSVRLLAIRQKTVSLLNNTYGISYYTIQLTPKPLSFPCHFQGTLYLDQDSLLAGIAAYYNLRFINYNASNGSLYFPGDFAGIITNNIAAS